MAQQTALSVLAVPGPVHSFVAKSPAFTRLLSKGLRGHLHPNFDPLLGMSRQESMAVGYPATLGLSFPHLQELFVLFRRKLYGTDIGPWIVVGLEESDASTIQNATSTTHATSTGYQYTVARCYSNGFVGPMSEPFRLEINNVDQAVTDMPLWPIDLDVRQTADGEFIVSWGYDRYGQSGDPAGFTVHDGPDADNVDYGTILGTVTFDPKASRHEFTTSEGYADGTARVFGVRAWNTFLVGGMPELNTFTSESIRAKKTAPTLASITNAGQPRNP